MTMGVVAAVISGTGATLLPTGPAMAAPVGQGFTVSAADLSFILKQIKIAERHVRTTTSETGPCSSLLGPAADQVPGPLVSYGLRTVDGTCNNLQPGRETFGAVDRVFPRTTSATFRPAEAGTTYASTGSGDGGTNVVDSEPRLISNLIVDQTVRNPAAVDVAGNPVRSQGIDAIVPCTAPGTPVGCTPDGETLFIPNITTDVGLSPPFNGWFTLFGQFFDHGLDFTSKTSDVVFVPLRSDDPLIAGPDHQLGTGDDLKPSLRFMLLSRTKNQPGADPADPADDVKDGINRDTPFVDQSQTYTSHPSHQVFLRDYAPDADGVPHATGKLLSLPDGGMSTWATVKAQAADELGIRLADTDVFNIPMLAVDAYGNFVPGPHGFPQLVTADGLVEGDPAADGGTGVAVPANVLRIDTAFLDDIAHHAVPTSGLDPDLDPGTTDDHDPGTYDDEMLDAHFVAGDGRTNENIGLTAVHQVFHSEHDRLVDDITATLAANPSLEAAYKATSTVPGSETFEFGERLFQAARFVTEMEYQHLVFEEFARKVQPALSPFTVYHDNIDPAITAEFAHAVYRFGHSMLTDDIARTNPDGTDNSIPLLDGFLNPPSYYDGGSFGTLTSEQAAGSIVMGMSDQTGNEIDEFVTETLRNNLLGLPLDLATLNLTRARDAGVPRLNAVRRQINAETGDSALQPYTSWVDFGLGLKHPQSLVNFVAAYGRHPSITIEPTIAGRRAAAQLLVNPPAGTDPALVPADAEDFMLGTGSWESTADGVTTTGVDDVDLWVGGLAESTNLFGGLLGSTFNYVFENQLLSLQNGDRFYYLARTPGMNLRAQLEGNSFAEMIMRNTTATTLKADSFATADCKFEMSRISSPAPAGSVITGAASVGDDSLSECDENALLTRLADGTIAYRTTNSVDPAGINGQSVYNGKAVADKLRGGVDNDTFLGNEGDDRIEGNDGADIALGGDGSDIITDLAGDDVPKGGPGDDVIDAGPGLDIVMGGDGQDFTNGGANDNETFGGAGDDFVIAGGGIDTVFGDSGSDWIEGGVGQELLCGDSCAPFFDDPNDPGADILIGQNGEEDYDAEGGDDIMVAGPGVERNAGAAGFDWSTGQGDPLPLDADLNLLIADQALPLVVLRDRYQEVEALSGASGNDVLRGDRLVPKDVVGGGFSGQDWLTQASLDRIAGLDAIVPPLVQRPEGPETEPVWGDGNILLGGDGSDLLEGREADDIIDGDRYLYVYLSVRSRTDHSVEIGRTELMESPYKSGSTRTLQQDVFAGVVKPSDIVMVREIRSAAADSSTIDTAVFGGNQADYEVVDNLDGSFTVTDTFVRGGGGGGVQRRNEGVDTLRNVECLQFADGRRALTSRCDRPFSGGITLSDLAPVEGRTLSVSSTLTDPDVIDPLSLQFEWQAQDASGTWVPVGFGSSTFAPNDFSVGKPLRVVATFSDGLLIQSQVTSEVTAPVVNVNDPTVGFPLVSGTVKEGQTLTASRGSVNDADGVPPADQLGWEWLSAATATGTYTPVAGATGATFTPTAAHVGRFLKVRLVFTDLQGTPTSALSAALGPVAPATTAPAAPTGVTAVAGLASATVSWTPPSNGGAEISAYTVEAVLPDASVATSVGTSGLATSVQLTGLAAGSYRFRVSATNAVGTGPASALSAPVTVVVVVAPGAPTITGTARGVGSVSATWTAPASDGGSPVTGYTLRAFTSAGVQAGADVVVAGSLRSATVTGLAAGTYTLRVLATNTAGNGPLSAPSAGVSPATVPAAPTGTTVVQTSGTATVSWVPPTNTGGIPLSGNVVQVVNVATGAVVGTRTAAAGASSLAVTGLTAGTTYRYRVRAVNAVGNGPLSVASAPALFATVPGAPVVGAATAGAAGGALTFTANWTPPASSGGTPVTGYRVWVLRMSGTGAGATVVSQTASPLLAATARSFVATVTTPAGTNYRFQVEAVNAMGTGARSARSANVVPR